MPVARSGGAPGGLEGGPGRDQPAVALHEPCSSGRVREGHHARLAAIVGRREAAPTLVARRLLHEPPARMYVATLDEHRLFHGDGLPGVEIANGDRGSRGAGSQHVRCATRTARTFRRAVDPHDRGRHVGALLPPACFAFRVRGTGPCDCDQERRRREPRRTRTHRRSLHVASGILSLTLARVPPVDHGEAATLVACQRARSGAGPVHKAASGSSHGVVPEQIEHASSTTIAALEREGRPSTICTQPLGQSTTRRSARS